MARLAERTRRISGSPTQKVTATVDRLRRSGVEVIDFGVGEPDFPTPEPVKDAARRAIDANFTKYTPNAGIADLRKAICDRYRTDYGVEFQESEVIVTAGGKQALYNTALALFGPGDEVITHAPFWPTIPEQIKLADATPVLVHARADDGFAIRASKILEKVTPKTRGILINSAARQGLWLIVDLCYEKLIYDAVPHNLPGIIANTCRDTGVICGSASKAYSMTGWRCGWTIGPAALVSATNAIQSHATSNVSSITQKAAVEALTGPQAPVKAMLDEYRVRRDRLYDWLTADPRVTCRKPAGAFYLFPDISKAIAASGLTTSAEFAEALLNEQQVAVTPGEAFGAPGFIRISYATSMDDLREGSRRLLEFVNTRAAATTAR
jgi:aspartate aminotransferase